MKCYDVLCSGAVIFCDVQWFYDVLCNVAVLCCDVQWLSDVMLWCAIVMAKSYAVVYMHMMQCYTVVCNGSVLCWYDGKSIMRRLYTCIILLDILLAGM